MDELMQKITEKLNISVDKVPEVYEMLKWQYVIYDTVNYIHAILYILLFTAGSAEVFFLLYSDNGKLNKKIILLSFIPFIVIILLIIILYVYRNINAPDVLFLEEVLKR